MEDNRNNQFWEGQEAKVDYSVAAGAREEIRRPRTESTASQTESTQNRDYNYEKTQNVKDESRSYDYSAENVYRRSEKPDIQFTSPNYDSRNAGCEDYKSSNYDIKNEYKHEKFEDKSFNYDARNDGSIPPEPPKKKRFGKREKVSDSGKGKRVLSVILIVCLCFAAGFGGGALAVNTLGGSSGGGVHNIKIDASDAQSLNTASVIAKKAMPSVVGISTVSRTYTQSLFGLQQGTATGIGTGIIVSEDGYIITNSHVVAGASSITVDLYDGKEYSGNVLWSDDTMDLAVVKINAKGLTAAELGDSDLIEIGNYVVAIGNPLGLDFERTVTQGIVSGLNRTITTTDGQNQNTMDGLIQTDAAINSGNSGGPLLNSSGCVIGINTAKASSGEAMGFAIPINTVIPIIEEIKASGTYEQPYLGITGYDLEDIIASYQTDFKAKEGVYISQIYTNSPAAKGGMIEGDIITALNGTKISDMTSLKKALTNYRPDDTVAVTVERSKVSMQLQITLGASSDINQNVLQGSGANGNSYSDSPNGSYYGDDGSQYYYYNGGLGDLYGGLFGN